MTLGEYESVLHITVGAKDILVLIPQQALPTRTQNEIYTMLKGALGMAGGEIPVVVLDEPMDFAVVHTKSE